MPIISGAVFALTTGLDHVATVAGVPAAPVFLSLSGFHRMRRIPWATWMQRPDSFTEFPFTWTFNTLGLPIS